jgi:hypothetical protein
VGYAQLLACLAQLLLALRLSRLPLGAGSIARLVSKLIAAAAAAFAPVVFFDALYGGGMLTSVGVKLVLFLGGCAVFRWLLGVFGVFDAGEKSALNDLLERRRMGLVGRLIGIA